MKQIYPGLFIGNMDWYENSKGKLDAEGWIIVHAAKEPYHRQILGYTERAAPKDHPEYLMAYRDNHLYLNLIDAPDYRYIPLEIINAALLFIDTALKDGKKVLVHCNQGESRAPGIGFLYLLSIGKLPGSFDAAEVAYRELYPDYHLGLGIRDFIKNNFKLYYRKTEQLDI